MAKRKKEKKEITISQFVVGSRAFGGSYTVNVFIEYNNGVKFLTKTKIKEIQRIINK